MYSRKDLGQVWFSPINTSEGPAINSGVEDRALFPDSIAYILPWNKGERWSMEFFAIYTIYFGIGSVIDYLKTLSGSVPDLKFFNPNPDPEPLYINYDWYK
jgi:hypothetical protein